MKIIIDLKRLTENVDLLIKELEDTALVKPPKLMAVVKANAYGHGLGEVSRAIDGRVDYFAVSHLKEALALQNEGIRKPILIFGPVQKDYHLLAERAFRFCLESEAQLAKVLAWCQMNPDARLYAHLKVDSGMARFGFAPDQVIELLEKLKKQPQLKVEGLFSHLPTTGRTNRQATFLAGQTFKELVDRAKVIAPTLLCHLNNSENMIDYPQFNFDMVRIGNGLYGPISSLRRINLQKIASVTTEVVAIRRLAKGQPIGYGLKAKASKATTVGIIDAGFYDGLGLIKRPIGLPRYRQIGVCFKNLVKIIFKKNIADQVIVEGQSFAVIGQPSMQYTAIDFGETEPLVGQPVIIRQAPLYLRVDVEREYIDD